MVRAFGPTTPIQSNQGGCATQVALRTGRRAQTIMGWVHAYNERGPEALAFRRTGGRPPFAPGSRPASARRCARPSAAAATRP
jgi:transposase